MRLRSGTQCSKIERGLKPRDYILGLPFDSIMRESANLLRHCANFFRGQCRLGHEVMVYREQGDATKGKALVQFLKWGVTDGQKYAPDLHYAPLPDGIVKLDQAKIDSIVVK